ncbi:MAG: Fe-S cluster assembly ATPase SufC [Candidatus Aenigmarchaeota archaeon]|nr:Fe-S cluster assembly ATPase SufC [Candidatus Aenigmarchaeota archaeon]
MNKLEIKDLHVSIGDKEIIKGFNLTIKEGEIHAVMGPNGSGKSTLSYAIMGHPKYAITKGEILFNGQNINELAANERAKLGLFLCFQYPMEVHGVQVANFLRLASNSVQDSEEQVGEFRKRLKENMKMLNISETFSTRYLNDGFSGGEKKRGEILQMAVLKPKIAILDEADSGLDIDALKIVAEGVNNSMRSTPLGVLIITHYQRILNFIKPNFVHIVVDGKIVQSGGPELAEKLDGEGYGWTYEKEEAAV